MADPDILKGAGRKTVNRPRCHLSQMHIMTYTHFIREKRLTEKQVLRPIVLGRPTAPSPSFEVAAVSTCILRFAMINTLIDSLSSFSVRFY